MNYLVIGAGNAGRPVARLLNNQNHNVIINITFHSMEVEYTFLIPGRIRLYVTGLE